MTHLVEDDFVLTKSIAKLLSDFEPREWHAMFEEPLRTARTAVAKLPTQTSATLVFGLKINSEAPPTTDGIEAAMIAGVYCRDGDEIVFGHLDPGFVEMDYLMPISASDDAFESGAAVATAAEAQKAAVRNEMFRAAMLGKQKEEQKSVNGLLVPVLVGAGDLR